MPHKVRLHGWRDTEAAYAKSPELDRESANGQPRRAALQLESEIRTGRDADPMHVMIRQITTPSIESTGTGKRRR